MACPGVSYVCVLAYPSATHRTCYPPYGFTFRAKMMELALEWFLSASDECQGQDLAPGRALSDEFRRYTVVRKFSVQRHVLKVNARLH